VSGKRSKSALRDFLLAEEPDTTAVAPSDPRASAMRRLGVAEAEVMEAIRDVFTGTGLLQDQVKISRILQVRAEIQKEWSDARDSFLAIGRALLSLEESLTRTEWQRLRQGSEKLFPFSDATATQLRQIARAVDSGRLPREQCPGSYGTAYQITLLSDVQLEAAQQRGLIRPDVTRREIMLLRREVRPLADTAPPKGRIDRAALREERRRLTERRDALSASLAQVEARLRQIDRVIGADMDRNGR
jgi:plasmid stabilization system protein ParE